MDKPAITALHIHPIIRERWSPRSFRHQPIEQNKLQRIFEAARWAPSSFNEQPWRFIVGLRGDETWNRLQTAMVSFNQRWAKNAEVLVLILSKKTLSKNGKPNSPYQYDAGQAAAYLTFQAMEEGLRVHQMGGFSKEKASSAFDIPEDFEPQTMMAMGYQDEAGRLDPDFEEKERAPRERKPLSELVFTKAFGNTFSDLIPKEG
jgi:nitroreductase